MRIIHFGDLHVWRWRFDWRDPLHPKRWLGWVNLGLRRRHRFPPDHAERVAADIASQEADWVVCTGDLSTMSLDEEFERAAELMAPIREKWGGRFVVIPGNHDRYTPRSAARYDRWFPHGRIEGVRTVDLDDGTALVLYDASRPFRLRSNGDFHPGLAERLDAALAAQAGRTVVLAGHYPYATPPEHPESWEHKLLGEESLAEIVARHRPVVYLHGHKHVRWAIRPRATPETLCLNCGAAGMRAASPDKQAGYLSLRLEDGSVEEVARHVLRDDGGVTCQSVRELLA